MLVHLFDLRSWEFCLGGRFVQLQNIIVKFAIKNIVTTMNDIKATIRGWPAKVMVPLSRLITLPCESVL